MRLFMLSVLLLHTGGVMAASRHSAGPVPRTEVRSCEEEALWTCIVRWNDGDISKLSLSACTVEDARRDVQTQIEGLGQVQSCTTFDP